MSRYDPSYSFSALVTQLCLSKMPQDNHPDHNLYKVVHTSPQAAQEEVERIKHDQPYHHGDLSDPGRYDRLHIYYCPERGGWLVGKSKK